MHALKQPIGILGGTFDPIHFGHLRTAVELQQALNLAEVHLLPCCEPVHRKPPLATPEQRLTMVQSAIKNEPVLRANDAEIKRGGPSYLIDTLETLSKQLPHTPLCFIMGVDALLEFPSWHRWQDILKLTHLIIAHRPQYQLPHTGIIAELLKERLQHNHAAIQQSLAGHIILHPVTPLDISASEVRKQIMMDKNVRYLLPDSVYDYIQQHGIYNLSDV